VTTTPFDKPTVDDIASATPAGDEPLWERRMRAVTMRNAGRTYAQIAEALTNAGTPVSVTQVRKDVAKAYKEIIGEARDDMIARQRSVLFDFQRANYLDAINSDPERADDRATAQKLILSAMDHEAKLFGLYSPQKVSLGISDTEFAEETARLISELGLEPPKELMLGREKREDQEEPVDAEIVEPVEAVPAPRVPDWSNI
jgi:hypothetical protein